MTINQVSKELGVSTKTLRRWEEKGYFVPERQGTTNIRLYHSWPVGYWKRMLELDRGLKKHLALLGDLRKELDKHLAKTPLDGQSRPMLDIKAFSKAHDAMEAWENEYKRLYKAVVEYPNSMLKATEDYGEDEK